MKSEEVVNNGGVQRGFPQDWGIQGVERELINLLLVGL
jgi:hypothetical protein